MTRWMVYNKGFKVLKYRKLTPSKVVNQWSPNFSQLTPICLLGHISSVPTSFFISAQLVLMPLPLPFPSQGL